MRGGVTRKKLLTRRKVADLTREIGLGHGGSLNTRIKEFVRPALREREKRFYGDGKGERRRTAFWRAAKNSLNASGAKLTRVCVPRTVNGTGQLLWSCFIRRLWAHSPSPKRYFAVLPFEIRHIGE